MLLAANLFLNVIYYLFYLTEAKKGNSITGNQTVDPGMSNLSHPACPSQQEQTGIPHMDHPLQREDILPVPLVAYAAHRAVPGL